MIAPVASTTVPASGAPLQTLPSLSASAAGAARRAKQTTGKTKDFMGTALNLS
jgi:hypothetical protein